MTDESATFDAIEESVIATLLYADDDATDTVETLIEQTSTDWFSGAYRVLHATITDRVNAGDQLDLAVIAYAVTPTWNPTVWGDPFAFIATLATKTVPLGWLTAPADDNGVSRLGILANRHACTLAATVGEDFVRQIRSGNTRTPRLLQDAVESFAERSRDIAESINPAEWVDAETMANTVVTEANDPSGTQPIPTGWTDLDAMMDGGLRRGYLGVVGARPAHGKSTVLANTLKHSAFDMGIPSLLVSYEMGVRETGLRLLASVAHVSMSSLRRGQLTSDEWDAVNKALPQFHDAPFYFLDMSRDPYVTSTLPYIRAIVRRHGIAVVGYDYLSRIFLSPGTEDMEERLRINAVAQKLLLSAKSLQYGCWMAAQLNRKADDRPVPEVQDLYGSAALDRDADVIVLLRKPDKYDPLDRPGEIDFHVRKNRHGPEGTVTAFMSGPYNRITDLPDHHTRW